MRDPNWECRGKRRIRKSTPALEFIIIEVESPIDGRIRNLVKPGDERAYLLYLDDIELGVLVSVLD
jgi:hypothetical protein